MIDMFLSLLFLSSTAKLLSVGDAARDDCHCSPNSSPLQKLNDQVLARHARAVVFPKNALLLLTPAFTKAILDGRPRGLLYTMEFDMYAPLPDTIAAWEPTVFVNNLKKVNASSQNVKANAYKTRVIGPDTESYFNDIRGASNDHYNMPFYDTIKSNEFDIEWRATTTSAPYRIFQKKSSSKNTNKFEGRAKYFHKQSFLDKRFYRENNLMDLNHEYRDRERRHILNQLEIVGSVFQLNMAKCLQRAICELTSHFSRSYGESVMEDIVRLILIPSYSSNASLRQHSNSNNSSNVNYLAQRAENNVGGEVILYKITNYQNNKSLLYYSL